jgi:predicted RNA-binding Zn ribbon-like protein
LVIDFVNTRDIEAGTDGLATPADLERWLAGHGLAVAPSATDHAAALELREALRAAMAAHNGAALPPAASATLDAAAHRGQLSVRFDEQAAPAIAPRASGVHGALAALLAPVAAASASADSTWARVKACDAPDCQWAFYDASRNRSGRWCDMAVCGNRTKVRSYRGRRASRPAL